MSTDKNMSKLVAIRKLAFSMWEEPGISIVLAALHRDGPGSFLEDRVQRMDNTLEMIFKIVDEHCVCDILGPFTKDNPCPKCQKNLD